jgi:HK97 family phage major capsid protein
MSIMDAMLKQLSKEREEKVSLAKSLADTAMEQGRDLSDNDQELITRGRERIAAIDKQIEVLSGDIELSQAAQDRLARLGSGVQSGGQDGPVEYSSIGMYLRDYLNTHVGKGHLKQEAEDRIKRYHRAAAHITTDNFDGVFPNALVGPVINTYNTSRPLVTALGVQSIPSGPTFRRPRLIDDHITDGVGIQAAQKDELVSQPFRLASDDVALFTLGGYVNVARQTFDWNVITLDTVIGQLARRYAKAVETAAIAEMSKSTGKVTLAAAATGAEIIAAFYDAAAMVFASTGELPTVIAAGPLGWARLGGASDAAGRPLFPFLAPGNAGGTMSADSLAANPVGLRLVVTPGVTDDSFWVVNDYALEVYEQNIPPLQVVEPSVLGVQVAYAGYVGLYRPVPNAAVHLAP